MAPSIASYETQTTINVSQDHHTPTSFSAHNGGATVQVHESVNVVEDSVKDVPGAHHGGAVQTPKPPPVDDEDELYSLSPAGKQSLENKKALIRKSRATDALTQPPMTRTIDSGRQPQAATPHNPVDTLLTEGATVHGPTAAKKGQPAKDQLKAVADDQLDELQSYDDGMSAPIGSHPKSTRKPARQESAKNAKNLQTPSTGKNIVGIKTPAGGVSSALAALQAKKQNQRSASQSGSAVPGTEGSKKTTLKPVKSTIGTRSVLQPLSRNAQTLARATAAAPPDERSQATGKSPSRKEHSSAQTPMNLPKIVKGTASKRKSEGGLASEGSNIVVDAQVAPKKSGVAPVAKSTLKRPARSPAPVIGSRKSIYEFPSSPVAEDAGPIRKKPRNAEGSLTTKAGAPDGDKRRAAAAASNRAVNAKHKSAAKHDAAASDDGSTAASASGAKNNTRRNVKLPEYQVSSRKLDNLATRPRRSERNKAPQTQQNPKPADENLEDFEHTVVHFDDDSGGHTTMAEGAVPVETSPRPMTSSSVKIKTEKGHDSGDQVAIPTHAPRPCKHGASQDDAIVLSDREEPSSPATSTPQHARVPQKPPPATAVQHDKARAPQTPAVMRSSPPLVTRPTPQVKIGGLVDVEAARRATIISFDKSGPRNQGSLSARKNVLGSAMTGRSSMPPQRVLLPSDASSGAKLEDRRRNGPSSAATSMKSYKTNRTAPPANVADTVSDALAGFMKKPLQDKTEHPAVQKRGEAASRPKPTPQKFSRPPEHDDGFAFIGDFEGPTLVDTEHAPQNHSVAKHDVQRTDSQIAMPPPSPKATKVQKPFRAPTVPAMLRVEEEQKPRAPERQMLTNLTSKRTRVEELSDSVAIKRIRVNGGSEDRSRSPNQALGNVSPLAQPAVAQDGRGLLLPRKEQTRVPDPIKRGTRKPTRHTSQGSQRVDLQGSPVPDGFTVLGNATALETFSQQAGLSSDAALQDVTRKQKPATVHERRTITQPASFMPPPSHQPEILSSNRKPLPAAPYAESQAVTKVVRVDPKRPFVDDQRDLPPSDPFTSSEEDRKQPPQGSSSSNFIDQLRRATAKTKGIVDTAQKSGGNDEDEDMTLVEPTRPTRATKRIPSLSTVSSSDLSAEANDSSSTMVDLGVWRNGLQPHQMRLFDELVNVSHRLVRHLVDAETAARDVVEDYHRRGLNLVEQMHLTHAKQQQKCVDTLKERKKKLRKELSDRSKKLTECVRTVNTAPRAQAEGRDKETAAETQLRKLVTEYC